MILLTLFNERTLVREYTLSDEIVRVGSISDNTVQIEDPAIEEHHFQLICRQSTWQLQDQSSGKLTVNGKPPDRANLANGDEIEFGNYRLTVFFTDGSEKDSGWDPDYKYEKTWKLNTKKS